MVQLDVDSEVNHVVGPLNPKPADHREPVFVGGVPGKCHLTGIFSNPETVSFHNIILRVAIIMIHINNNKHVINYNE